MDVSRVGAGRVSLDHLILEVKMCSENDRHRSQLIGAPTGQIWDNLSIKISNDGNGL